MRRKIGLVALSGLLVMNSTFSAVPVFATNSTNVGSLEMSQNKQTGKIIYVADGEGVEGSGQGTKQFPYQNIRTALEKAENGDTIYLVGTVKYTKYKTHEDLSALPLYIDTSITIEGDYETSCLTLRTSIQLGADVTFKNMRINMVPETIFPDADGAMERMLGDVSVLSTTIYTAGHSLTLDKVNTKIGESPAQANMRPYISGGAYKGTGVVGERAIINIVNPTSETRIGGIYAGDYFQNRKMDVVLNLDGKLVDTTIHTGGYFHSLDGDVYVNVSNGSNIKSFDRFNHDGNLHVRMKAGVFSDLICVDGVEELVLEEGARITVPNGTRFSANHVSLGKQATLDFRHGSGSPVVQGDFEGPIGVTEVADGAAVILNNTQTLAIGGSLKGLTRLNDNGEGFVDSLKEGHAYISAAGAVAGSVTIEGTKHKGFEVIDQVVDGKTVWTVQKKAMGDDERFQSFRWVDEHPQKIIVSEDGVDYLYEVEFFDVNNQPYKPDGNDLRNRFDYMLERKDGKFIDPDMDYYLEWDDGTIGEDQAGLSRLYLALDVPENLYGELELKLTHKESRKQIVKQLRVLEEDDGIDFPEEPTVKPTAEPTVKPTAVPTAAPTVKPTAVPTAAPTVKPTEVPTVAPTVKPTVAPTVKPTAVPTAAPTVKPTAVPTTAPTVKPTVKPTIAPTVKPTAVPTVKPTVKPTPTPKITLNQKNATIYVTGSKTVKLTATVVGSSKTVAYSTNNKKVATVDKNGKVTAQGVGTAIITAKANGVSTTCKITVKPTSLTVDRQTATLYTEGQKTLQLKVKTIGVNNKVSYTSSNKKVAKVDKNGKVTALAPGKTTITITANGLTRKCNITVKKPTLDVGKANLTVKKGKRIAIKAKATPSKAIVFTSSNKKIATVDKNGVVKGIKPGKVKITIQCNNIKKTVTVTVKK